MVFVCILLYKAEGYPKKFELEGCKTALLMNKNLSFTELFEAIEIESDQLKQVLEKQTSVGATNKNKKLQNKVEILLYYASLLGNSESIRTLVSDLNFDVNIRDSKGRTALHYAALNEDILSRFDTVYILINLGADPSIKDDLDNTPSFYVKERSKSRYFKERRLKGAELFVVNGVNRSYLLEFFQINSFSLDKWVKDYKEQEDMSITREGSSKGLRLHTQQGHAHGRCLP